MNNFIYSKKVGKAYYYADINNFLRENTQTILGCLVQNAYEDVEREQRDAWTDQIKHLKDKLEKSQTTGYVIFEYDIQRLGKRIDVVILIKHMVFSLEFKNGKTAFLAEDKQQAEDYATDIKNFHKESENLYVCPILIATEATKVDSNQQIDAFDDKQITLQKENKETFMQKILQIADKYGDNQEIDFYKWFNSPYYPTPTIIEAAKQVYSSHSLSEIAKSESGQEGVDNCEREINNVVNEAKNKNLKSICFVTGVPGAGKTLVGLNTVANLMNKDSNLRSVYLSGNGPLVEVLQAALESSYKKLTKRNLVSREKSGIRSLIQNNHNFRKTCIDNPDLIPTENVIVFDEAQRVWDAKKMKEWTTKKASKTIDISEPEFLIETLNKKTDWCVLICLVGLGQDIYNGEAGINEWFRIFANKYKNWNVYLSSKILNQLEDKTVDKSLLDKIDNLKYLDLLHLSTSIRSFRADKESLLVDYLLDNKPDNVKEIYKQIKDKYKIYITRDLSKAKQWCRHSVRGSQRCGLLACSSAQRLKPDGVFVLTDIDTVNWFLAPSDDIRSSNMMEIAASEFKVQGLEVDWATVCWDADLRRTSNDWDYYNFRGTHWNHRRDKMQIRYLLNAYRVLLTRARQGMCVFVPKGSIDDPTREPKFYDAIYNYLKLCGLDEIKDN